MGCLTSYSIWKHRILRNCHRQLEVIMLVEITDDYYAILEITQTAKDDVVKASYKRLARVRHPDKDARNPNVTADLLPTGRCLSFASGQLFHELSIKA